jgi:hypothetical protein
MTISEAISKIQSEPRIPQAELKYNETAPLSAYITIDLTEDGIILSFEPASQRLRLIEIYKTVKLILRYSGSLFWFVSFFLLVLLLLLLLLFLLLLVLLLLPPS